MIQGIHFFTFRFEVGTTPLEQQAAFLSMKVTEGIAGGYVYAASLARAKELIAYNA